MNRRDLLHMGGLLAAAGPVLAQSAWAETGSGSKSGLQVLDVKQYGAAGDGKTLDSAAINRAINACNGAGGGVVYAPPGTYLCGTVVLKSNVTLYLEAGATLLGSTDLAHYAPQPGPPLKGDANGKHLIFARDAQNVGLAGTGRIDGQGRAFWVPSGRAKPAPEQSWRDVATYDWKALDRPSPMLEFYNCKNLRLEDVRIENAPGWTLRPIQCENVFIRGISIKNPVIGPNTDGLDLTCSQNVFISDCLIDTGDDAICLKSESPYGGPARVSKNITITNCVLTCCCNGLKFGTATRGGFENITFSNSLIFNEEVELNARVIAGIALEMVDGGWLEGVVISNIRMQRVRTPIFLRRGARHARADGTPGTLRGVMIDNVQASGAVCTSSVTGLPGFAVEDVTLSNIRIDSQEAGRAEWGVGEVPEAPGAYPEARMFGRLPAAGLYCRHVKGIRLRNLDLRFAGSEGRPAIVCEDVEDLEIQALRTTPLAAAEAAIKLVQTRQVLLQGCVAPAGAKTFIDLQGGQTDHVVLMNNDLTAVQKTVQSGPAVPTKALLTAGNAEAAV